MKIRDQAAALRTQASSAFAAARDGQGVVVGNTVRTNGTGFAQVNYRDGSLTRLDANAQLTLTDLSTAQQAQRVVATLKGGRAWSRVKKITSSQGRYEIDTAVASASVRGTTFTVDCTAPDGSCVFTVIDGVVTVTPHGGAPVQVHAGESVTVHKDGALTHDPSQSPDQLTQSPWNAKNLTIDTAEPAPATAPTADKTGKGFPVSYYTGTATSTYSSTYSVDGISVNDNPGDATSVAVAFRVECPSYCQLKGLALMSLYGVNVGPAFRLVSHGKGILTYDHTGFFDVCSSKERIKIPFHFTMTLAGTGLTLKAMSSNLEHLCSTGKSMISAAEYTWTVKATYAGGDPAPVNVPKG